MTITSLSILGALALPILVACAGAPERTDDNAPAIIVDGDLSDWTTGPGLVATPSELIVHFVSHDEAHAIQAADFTTRFRIDADADPATGKRMTTNPLSSGVALSMGVEIQAELSPRDEDRFRAGSRAALFPNETDTFETGHHTLGFYVLPTHNAPSYEARFDRAKLAPLQHDGRVVVAVDAIDAQGNILSTQRFETTLPEFAPRDPHDGALPERTGIRAVSANILRSKPLADPEPFARILAALDPDIVLSQEWFGTDRADYEAWFAQHTEGAWNHAYSSDDHGVAIASRYPVLETRTLERSSTRAIFALLDTPGRPLLCVSIHLKCCGGAQSFEDVKRFQEADEINAQISIIRSKHPGAAVLIAGDVNLVGTRRPLDVLGMGLAIDDRDLTPAHTVTLGATAAITWTQADSSFSPGRLDWILYDDSAYDAAHAFTLDTELLSPELLEASGLDPLDSRVSDHLPLVVDLRARPED